MQTDPDIGAEHLHGALRTAQVARRRSRDQHSSLVTELELLGTSLSALFLAATCHRKCFGGSHVLEALAGRVYNHGTSAYLLAESGFYDEALNLTRSIGEVANLIALSVVDKDAFTEWLTTDTHTRRKKYSPVKVRRLVKDMNPDLLIVNDDWYSEFCERYTHATPETRPNLHAVSGRANVGGVHDPVEFERVVGELASIVASVSMIVSKYADLDDVLSEIVRIVQEISAGHGGLTG